MTPARPGDDSDFQRLFAPGDEAHPHGSGAESGPAVPSSRARRRRRIRAVLSLVAALVVVALVGGYLSATLLAPVPGPTVVVTQPVVQPAPAAALAIPYAAAAAVSIAGAGRVEGGAGLEAVQHLVGDDTARPIASITKVVTALVVLSAKPLDIDDDGPILQFGEVENDTYDRYFVLGATIAPMKIGSAMSQRDTLEMVLAVSASNYADVLATWTFGSEAGYRAATRRWLAANGLTGTTVVEPTGIDPRNTSTPSDLVAIGRLALANPVVAAIVSSTTVEVAGLGMQSNRNSSLGVEGIDGIKTGTLEEAGACLLFSARVSIDAGEPLSVVGVMLGADDHGTLADDARALMRSIRDGFHRVPLVQEGDVLGTYDTPWGDDADVVAAETASVFTWSSVPVAATLENRPVVEAPSGTEVGAVTYVVGATTVTVPLVLRGGIAGPGGQWRVTHPFEVLGEK
jgi:D-alanyl-D-alanine carboxypeptidase (penicillin-binding protein 5/6)